MPEYHYQAVDDSGKLCRGTITAMNEADIELRLGQKQLTLVESSEIQASALDKMFTGGSVKPRILIEFYHRLSQTLELGLPILAALEENAKELPSKGLKRAIGEMIVALEGGNTLYEAMKRFPRIFENLDLAIVMMGEQAGILPKSLKDLANFQEWKEDIRSTIRRAAMYPAFIMVTILGVIGVWVGYVLPQLASVLKDMGVTLPPLTQAVLSTSIFIQEQWPIIAGLCMMGIVGFFLLLKTPGGRFALHKYLLKAPIIGNVAGNIAIARLSHNFAALYSAGMTINTIFDILTNNVIGNRYIEVQLGKVYREVQAGSSLTDGFETVAGFPPLLVGGVRNGESTGTLDATFNRLGDYYDGEVKRAVQSMVNAIEPITTLLLGGVFGLIALSILLPLYDVIGEFN